MTAIVTDAHYRMSVSLIRDLFDRGVRVAACEKDAKPCGTHCAKQLDRAMLVDSGQRGREP